MGPLPTYPWGIRTS